MQVTSTNYTTVRNTTVEMTSLYSTVELPVIPSSRVNSLEMREFPSNFNIWGYFPRDEGISLILRELRKTLIIFPQVGFDSTMRLVYFYEGWNPT